MHTCFLCTRREGNQNKCNARFVFTQNTWSAFLYNCVRIPCVPIHDSYTYIHRYVPHEQLRELEQRAAFLENKLRSVKQDMMVQPSGGGGGDMEGKYSVYVCVCVCVYIYIYIYIYI